MSIMAIAKATMTWAGRALGAAGALAALAIAVLYAFQEKILYVPVIPGVPNEYKDDPSSWGMDFEEVWLTASDGTRLQCWHIHAPGRLVGGRPPVVLFFQENAGNMSMRLHFLHALTRRVRCAIFVLGYRGYGQSEGSPHQAGIEQDAEAALAHVRGRDDIDPGRVVVYGKSLGGAVTLHLAARHQDSIRAVIVENTFTSVEDMVGRVVPLLGGMVGEGKPLNFLVRNKWRSREKIRDIRKLPLLMIASPQDELVPYSQMLRLKELVTAKQFMWVDCPSSGHMDAYVADESIYWRAVQQFWQKYVLEQSR